MIDGFRNVRISWTKVVSSLKTEERLGFIGRIVSDIEFCFENFSPLSHFFTHIKEKSPTYTTLASNWSNNIFFSHEWIQMSESLGLGPTTNKKCVLGFDNKMNRKKKKCFKRIYVQWIHLFCKSLCHLFAIHRSCRQFIIHEKCRHSRSMVSYLKKE